MPVPFTAVPEFEAGLLQSTTSRSLLSRNTNGTIGLFDATNMVTGSGVAGRIPLWTGANTLGNSLIRDTGSRVIVGSDTGVDSLFEVITAGTAVARFQNTNTASQAIVRVHNASALGLAIQMYGSAFVGGSVFSVGPSGVAISQQAPGPMAIGTFGQSQPLLFGTSSQIRATLTAAGNWLLNTVADTGERLQVNGIVRIDTVDEATGDFLTRNATTNRITRRTAAQVLGDIGAWSISGNAPAVDTTFLGTTNARPFDIRVNNVIVATFAVGGAINFGSPSSSSSVLNIGGGASIFAQGTITAPGITEDATAATNYLTLGGSNIIRRRSVAQVKSDLGIFDSIHNQTSTYQSANFRVSGVGRFGAPAGYSEISASSLFSNQNYSIRTPRLYVSNNDITSDLSGLGWKMIIDSGTATGEGLYIKGRILSTNNVSASSDRRLKKNITRLHDSDVLMSIEGKTYLFGGKHTAGFIAQDVQKYLPHLVNKESNGYFSMDYVGLIPYIVEFIKSDRDKIKELEREIQKLKALINVT